MSTRPEAPHATPSGPQIREVRRGLYDAHDEKVARVVDMVDRLAARGAADALIAGLRPRLAAMQVRRPVNFTRLLFMPLDPLIAPASTWRRGAPTLPRTCLLPLATQLRDAMPELAEDIDRDLAGRSTDDLPMLESIGARLWAAGSRQFRGLKPPASWLAATGLDAADHAELCTVIGAVLDHGAMLARLASGNAGLASAGPASGRAKGRMPAIGDVERALTAAAMAGPRALTMLMILLIAQLPDATQIATLARGLALKLTASEVREATDISLDFLVDHAEKLLPMAGHLACVTRELASVAGVLDDVAERSGHDRARPMRANQVRRQIDQACQERFRTALVAQGLGDVSASPALDDPASGDFASNMLENTFRDLRRFERVARRIGSAGAYDKMLSDAGLALRPPIGAPPAEVVRRIRLVEILCGPDRAMALLGDRPGLAGVASSPTGEPRRPVPVATVSSSPVDQSASGLTAPAGQGGAGRAMTKSAPE